MEIWKDISGYDGVYKVSSYGRVMSLKRPKVRENKILIPFINPNGYYCVKLTKDGDSKTFKVHKLVCIAFLNHTPRGYELVVDHIDENKLNNKVENLRLTTHRDNCIKHKLTRIKKSIYPGVCIQKDSSRFYSTIKINRKSIMLGTFNCETRAYMSYLKAIQFINQFVSPKQFRELINNSLNKKILTI